jgi:hypothetical protein
MLHGHGDVRASFRRWRSLLAVTSDEPAKADSSPFWIAANTSDCSDRSLESVVAVTRRL